MPSDIDIRSLADKYKRAQAGGNPLELASAETAVFAAMDAEASIARMNTAHGVLNELSSGGSG